MSVPPDFLYQQLSRFPKNLLKWFGIPGGQNPSTLARDYQPVLDLWEWLASGESQAFITAGTGIVAGGAGSYIIDPVSSPTGHVYVLEYTIRFTPIGAGGGEFACVPAIQVQQGSGVEVAVGDVARTISAGAASAGEVIVARADHPFFLGPAAVAFSLISTKNTLVNAATAFGYIRFVTLSP